MTITPVDVGDVMAALAKQLERSAAVQAAGIETVERCEPEPDDSDRCPWVGIFRVRVSFPTRTSGVGAGFRQQLIRIGVGMAQSDATSGAACEERLEELVKAVVGAILSDATIGSTVSFVDEFELVYPAYEKLKDQPYLQLAYLEFTAVAQVSYS